MRYWTFERDGEISEMEFETMSAALAYADEKFCEECSDDGGWANGETVEEEIFLLEIEWNDETDERKTVQRIKGVVLFENYHGDLAEHGTWHSGGGGVL